MPTPRRASACSPTWAGRSGTRTPPDNLIEFEARANFLHARHQHVVICSYDTSRFDGAFIVDILRTHPMVLIGGILQENPFFVPPRGVPRGAAQRRGARLSGGWTPTTGRWMRDLGALLALPSLWVDHSPTEIADGLLSVLIGMLRLDSAFARFRTPGDGGTARSVAPVRARQLRRPAGRDRTGERLGRPETGAGGDHGGRADATERRRRRRHRARRHPGAHAAVGDGTRRGVRARAATSRPSGRRTCCAVAVGQAAIALHTARRLAGEQGARREGGARARAAEPGAPQSLLDEVGPALVGGVQRRPAGVLGGGPAGGAGRAGPCRRRAAPSPSVTQMLTRRELEVLGLLAQGLSNKEIAGVMWLSDRTVERHITSLYRKIGVARRSEATAFALRHGIA